jgi:hypothetical protein
MSPIPYSHYVHNNLVKANSNFADYVSHKPYVSCAWMEFHDDNDDWRPLITQYMFKVVYCHPNAVFVHHNGFQYTLCELCSGAVVAFNHKKKHAILPRWLARKVVSANRINVPGYRKWVRTIDGQAFKAKLVWSWVT